MLPSANKLLIIIYLTISLEWALNDQFIAIRYLHFGYLFFFLFTVGLALYLLIRQPRKLVWLSPALIIISINFINPLLPSSEAIASEPPQSKVLAYFLLVLTHEIDNMMR